jgi:hypothetical protein
MGIVRKLLRFLDMLEARGTIILKFVFLVLCGIGAHTLWEKTSKTDSRPLSGLVLLALLALMLLLSRMLFRH